MLARIWIPQRLWNEVTRSDSHFRKMTLSQSVLGVGRIRGRWQLRVYCNSPSNGKREVRKDRTGVLERRSRI